MKKALVITGVAVVATVVTYMIVKAHKDTGLDEQEREKMKEDALREVNKLFE